MAVRILYMAVVLLFVPGLVHAQRNIGKIIQGGKTTKIPQEIGKDVSAIHAGVVRSQVKALTSSAGVSHIPVEIARHRVITPIDYTPEEKATFPILLETLVNNSLFHMYSFLETPQLNVMMSLFEIYPDKTIPLTKLFHRIGIKNKEICSAATKHPEVIQFLNNHPNYETVEGEELPAFIDPLLRATFPRHRHGYIQEKPEAFMGQLFKSFPEYKIPLTKVFLSRWANGVEILEAAEHDKEVARFLFSYPGIVNKALQKRRVIEVSRPDDYLFSYKQLHFMQTGLEANPDRVTELLGVFKQQGAPREELLYISVAYPKIVESMLYEPLSENVKSSIAWNALKYNHQETALLFATDNRAIAMLGAYAALLEKWDFMERLLREYPQVTPEDILQALLDRRPLPWAGSDYPSYYEPSWSDLYNHGEKRRAIVALSERYVVARDVDLNCY